MTRTPAPASSTSTTGTRWRFSARDLLNVAIFGVLYFVVVFGIAMLGIISPLVMLLTLPLSAIAAGIPYMLYLTRVRHAGMVTLFGIVLSLLYMMIGHPWQGAALTLGCSLIGELILWLGRYKSKWAAIWAYTVFSAWFLGPYIPLIVDREAYLRSAGMEAMGADYIAAFDQTVSAPAILGMWLGTILCGFLGALLGTSMLRKHFRRAGLA